MLREETQSPFVACAEGIVHQNPLSYGKKYVGQTGRYLNDRLHALTLTTIEMATYHFTVKTAECRSLFGACTVLARHKNKNRTRGD